MPLLEDAIAATFAGAFAGIFLDATLHRPTITEDDEGGGTSDPDDDGEPVKAQLEAATEAMRAAEGYTEKDVRILVLAHGVDEPDSDCEITVRGVRYLIANVGRDPAGAYWDLHGRRA